MIQPLPPQVRIVCDSCEEPLGDGDSSWMVFDADDPRLDETARDYDWRVADGKHTCPSCLDEGLPPPRLADPTWPTR